MPRVVKIANTADSVAPECVVPLVPPVPTGEVAFREGARQRGHAPRQEEVRTRVKLSIQDCFSCSGCVTSAETVLVEHHNTGEARKLISRGDVTVSIATQSLLAIAEALVPAPPADAEATVLACLQALASALKRLGCARVVPLFVSQQLSCEAALADIRAGTPLVPVCPAWVCLCTKQHADLVPLLGHARSPMAVFGTLAHPPAHISVQPCYDRKLEAARDDVAGVCDLVLTTDELLELLAAERDALRAATEAAAPVAAPAWDGEFGEPARGPLTALSCGGYVEYAVARLCEEGFTVAARRALGRFETETVLARGAETRTLIQAHSLEALFNMRAPVAAGRVALVEPFACRGGCLRGNGQRAATGWAAEWLPALPPPPCTPTPAARGDNTWAPAAARGGTVAAADLEW